MPPGRVKSAPVGLHLLRRAPGHRRRRHPGDAGRQRQGMDLFLAHFAETLDQDAPPSVMCSAPVGTTSAFVPDNVRLGRCCRLTVPNSTPSSGFGSTYAGFLSLRVLDDTKPSSTTVAKNHVDRPHREPDGGRTLCAGRPWITTRPHRLTGAMPGAGAIHPKPGTQATDIPVGGTTGLSQERYGWFAFGPAGSQTFRCIRTVSAGKAAIAAPENGEAVRQSHSRF